MDIMKLFEGPVCAGIVLGLSFALMLGIVSGLISF